MHQVAQALEKMANPSKAALYSRFFKTGRGEYGEGDVFLGVTVPKQRKIAKQFKNLPLHEIKNLLHSKFHEHRLVALLILIGQFKSGDTEVKKTIFDIYCHNTKYINNWDLVDLSAAHIVGQYLSNKDKTILYKFARSSYLWERRIAMISCFFFIRDNFFEDAFSIAEILLHDKHDLIHKAVGWMLREIGKRNQEEEEKFLKIHYKIMPRTMLRYAIERFDDAKRQKYMLKDTSP